MKKAKNTSQTQNFNGATISGSQISQNSGNLYQTNVTQTVNDDKQFDPKVIVRLVENLRRLINMSGLPSDSKGKCDRHLQSFKDETLSEKPDKDYAAQTLQKVFHVITGAGKTTVAAVGLMDKLQPMITRIVPWLGEAKKFLQL